SSSRARSIAATSTISSPRCAPAMAEPQQTAGAGPCLMALEAAEAPAVVARQLAAIRPILEDLAARLRARPPAFVVTCARGSSGHAALYGKYLIETGLGLVTADAAPSV